MGRSSSSFKKGMTPWNKGVPRDAETRKKISMAHIGFKHTEASKKKMSVSRKGKTTWNKGISTSAAVRQKISIANKGKLIGRTYSATTILKMIASKIGNRNPMYGKCGSLNPIWKGTQPLNKMIRKTNKYKDWRKSIFIRDHFTCRVCGKTAAYIEPHHIKPFSHILDDFLKLHDEDLLTDKEILVNMSLDYPPFWDLANGVTLCRSCHGKTKRGCATKCAPVEKHYREVK